MFDPRHNRSRRRRNAFVVNLSTLLTVILILGCGIGSMVESVSLSFSPSFLHHHLHSPGSRANKQQTLRSFFQSNGDIDDEDSRFSRLFYPLSSSSLSNRRRHEASTTQEKSQSPPALIDTRTNNKTNNRYSDSVTDVASSSNKVAKQSDLSKVDLVTEPSQKSNKQNEYVPVISTRNSDWDPMIFRNERRSREMLPFNGNSYRPKAKHQSDTNNDPIPRMLMGNNFFGDNDFDFGQFSENPHNKRNKNGNNNKQKKVINTNTIPSFQKRHSSQQQPSSDNGDESDFEDIFKMDDFSIMPF